MQYFYHQNQQAKSDVVSYVTDNFKKRNISPDNVVSRSWERSILNYGLAPEKNTYVEVLTSQELKNQIERHRSYLKIARNGLNGLAKRINPANYAVLLTDEIGVTLDARLPEETAEDWIKSGLRMGSVWTERNNGTNGIGTCLVEKQPLIIHRNEHFFDGNSEMSCAVSPIFEPTGKLMGCLNASCLGFNGDKQHQYLTLQMVMMFSRMIENTLFKQTYRNQIHLNIRKTSFLSDLACEQFIAVSEDGEIIGSNRAAYNNYVGLLPPDVKFIGCNISGVIGLNLEQIFSRSNGGASEIKLNCPLQNEEIEITLYSFSRKMTAPSTRAASKLNSDNQRHKHPSLDQLAGNDLTVQNNVNQIKNVINQDIPILITGETGTGKEAFARAIHDASERSSGPFIALNCAAIPESLIESELFGYRSGSFTGANRKGMKGKLELANGGTIFLDEIGDMPIQLQTRLLRVLAEREVFPLGATSPTALDIQVISATHQNLLDRIRDKFFREDFYYRLNGMSLHLPPLRERTDKDLIIRDILDSDLGGAFSVSFSPQAEQLLYSYHWPGNIRQLANVLRYAIAMSKDRHIALESLPVELKTGKQLDRAGFNSSSATVNQNSNKDTTLSNFLDEEEGKKLLESLRKYKWNITLVSGELGVCRSTIYRKMRKYGIKQPNEVF